MRSKYGTDLIFKLYNSVEEQKDAGICSIKHYCYNELLVEECKSLGGKWDAEEKVWVMPGFVEDKVEDLEWLFNDEVKSYEVKFLIKIGDKVSSR